MNSVWAFALKGAGFVAQTEVYTDLGTKRRSADTYVGSWEHGRSAAHDWVISHALQKSALDRGGEPDFAVRQSGPTRTPTPKNGVGSVASTSSLLPWTRLAAWVLTGAGRLVLWSRGRGNALCDRTASRLCLRQRLQVAAMRGVARQLLRRVRVGRSEEE